MELKYLSEEQNAAFDSEYHSKAEFDAKVAVLREHFPNGPASILDLGGGNGRFLDMLLDAFPEAQGYLVDVSQHLLDLNKPHSRKTLVCASIDQLDTVLEGRKFDLITFNWLLHHLVSPTYHGCADNCVAALRVSRNMLTTNGAIYIAENLFEGFGGSNIPSHTIYAVTSVRSPSFVRMARRFFNTAGVGVCFRNERDWKRVLRAADLTPAHIHYKPWATPKPARRLLMAMLGLASRGHGHFFCPIQRADQA